MDDKIKLAIAEDFALEREGLISLLRNYDNFEIVLSCGNGMELLEGMKKVVPDILLLDIEMQVMDGRTTFDRLQKNFPEVKIIMLTEHFTDSYILEFMQKGASAFLSKNNRIEKLVETINRVHVNGKCFDNIVANVMVRASTTGVPLKPFRANTVVGLTVREIEILRLTCMGKENKEISELLNIEVRTIESHRRNIWAKTHCNNVVELIEFAFKHNLISI